MLTIDVGARAPVVLPALLAHVEELGGTPAVDLLRGHLARIGTDRLSAGEGRRFPSPRPPMPATIASRLAVAGAAFAVVRPSNLTVTDHPDPHLRQLSAKALNAYAAEAFRPFGEVVTPAAVLPMATPGEALDVLEHAVGELGLKCVAIPAGVLRRSHGAAWLDTYGLSPVHDYGTLFRRLDELGVAVLVECPSQAAPLRTAPHDVVAALIAGAGPRTGFAASLIFSGWFDELQGLRFGMLTTSAAWAAFFLSQLVRAWEAANECDHGTFAELGEAIHRCPPTSGIVPEVWPDPSTDSLRSWSAAGLLCFADVRRAFTERFHIACQPADPLSALAFRSDILPGRRPLRAMVGTDIGRWDLTDRSVARELAGLRHVSDLTDESLEDLAFNNAVRLLGRPTPSFFDGTVVDIEATRILLSDANGCS